MRSTWLALGLLIATPAVAQEPPPAALQSTAFNDGLRDRAAVESWVAGLNGDYLAGAAYWAAHRSIPREATCAGAGDRLTGCQAAKARFTPLDARRKAEPEYRLGWNSYQQPKNATDGLSKLAADKAAERFAYKAARGDSDAKDKLVAESNSGSPSAKFAMATYLYDVRSQEGPSLQNSVLLDEVAKYDPVYARKHSEVLSSFRASPDSPVAKSEEVQRRIVGLLEAAVAQGDPGAKGSLGAEIVSEVVGMQVLLDRMGPSRMPNLELISAERRICARAIQLLSDADSLGWPAAPTDMAILWMSARPGQERLASGCAFPQDLEKVHQLLLRSAERGYPDAIYSLLLGAREAGDSTLADHWIRRLGIEASAGTPNARELLDRVPKQD